MAELTFDAMDHQKASGSLVSLENPIGSTLFKHEQFHQLCGELEDLDLGWGVVRSDGCQFNKAWPGREHFGDPVEKGQLWVSNFGLEGLNRRCKGADSVAQWTHEHRHVRGSVRVEEPDGSHYWTSVGAWSGEYTARRTCGV